MGIACLWKLPTPPGASPLQIVYRPECNLAGEINSLTIFSQKPGRVTLPCLATAEISGQESERRQAGSEHLTLASGRYSHLVMPPIRGSCFMD